MLMHKIKVQKKKRKLRRKREQKHNENKKRQAFKKKTKPDLSFNNKRKERKHTRAHTHTHTHEHTHTYTHKMNKMETLIKRYKNLSKNKGTGSEEIQQLSLARIKNTPYLIKASHFKRKKWESVQLSGRPSHNTHHKVLYFSSCQSVAS
jgi:hypothetical protein